MLNKEQIEGVWKRRIEAETRSLYFADFTNRYCKRKQLITGLQFFFSSGAAATLVGKLPGWVPTVLSIVVAILSAYVMAMGLDRKVQTLAKLHSSWDSVYVCYDHLWNHAYEDDSEAKFLDLLNRERELSALGATEAPNDQRVLGKWEDHVLQQYQLIKT